MKQWLEAQEQIQIILKHKEEKMRKLVIALFILSVLVSACQTGNQEGAQGVPFIGGTTGVLVSYAEDAPPAEVYDGGDFPFDIELKLQNDGERTVKRDDIIVKITGVDPTEFGKTTADFVKSPAEDLTAKKKDTEGNVIDSTPVYVTFPGLNHKQMVTGDLNYPILASVCYRYGTDAVGRVCIKENPQEKGGVCDVAGTKDILNSGSPLQITSLTESVVGASKVRMTFKIEHKGSGRILKQDTDCNAANSRDNKNKVYVSVSTGLPGLVCSNLKDGTETAGYVLLQDTGAIISCEQSVTAVGAFLKTVDIKLEFDYEQDLSTTIAVKHSE
jgi:hypothetical protein